MMSYIGQLSIADILGADNPRYFYGLRRVDGGVDDGAVYFGRLDQLTENSAITVNTPGSSNQNFEDFEYGVDFFDGRSEMDHSRPYANLKYDQFRWDNKNCYYYIDADGELVVRINQPYSYNI
jgi:hypothetical protein